MSDRADYTSSQATRAEASATHAPRPGVVWSRLAKTDRLHMLRKHLRLFRQPVTALMPLTARRRWSTTTTLLPLAHVLMCAPQRGRQPKCSSSRLLHVTCSHYESYEGHKVTDVRKLSPCSSASARSPRALVDLGGSKGGHFRFSISPILIPAL